MTSKLEYLLAVYIEESRGSRPVPFDKIADKLDRSPATVTETCQRLDEEGLVRHEPYQGVTLTSDGREVAESHHDRYVVLSWFFRSILDLEEYEREAMEMAGVISPEVADRLAATLPYTDESQTPTSAAGEPQNATE
ncbi:iron (metal) dependent repressor, DtxR family [Halovenus aranensis]|jgi:DtxR family Mn-dependent transcriptional regulator|uniref:Iron (Metal) dependent repressor, DtxR family n=1 Tax=Halovenus aranensis TaxID=890420 RepID=A0A1G8UTX1_9EURY|nr:metal-dependent transcriptional regulator [Halovenus aranensis]SDJ57241.1 iron (metal) dependent repressor, DtxR family [Halovenus aranensis]